MRGASAEYRAQHDPALRAGGGSVGLPVHGLSTGVGIGIEAGEAVAGNVGAASS
jgi:class 3 adenylate cyclase